MQSIPATAKFSGSTRLPARSTYLPSCRAGTLYLQSLEDPSVEALDRQDGSLRWRITIPAEENIASLIATATTLYVPLTRVVVAISAGDGSVLTRYPTDETNSGAAVAGNLLLVGVAGSLDARLIGSGSLVWHVSLPDYSTAPPLVGSQSDHQERPKGSIVSGSRCILADECDDTTRVVQEVQ